MEAPLRQAPAADVQEARVQHEAQTFESFYRATHPRLFGALCIVTGNRAEAEEISQDAFLRVWERWDRISLMEQPEGFAFRTAMNLFRNRHRRARLALRRVPPALARPDELLAVEDRDVVERALRDLTPRERAAVLLTCYVGLTSEEAGRTLRIRAGTVRTLTARARATMRTTMEEVR